MLVLVVFIHSVQLTFSYRYTKICTASSNFAKTVKTSTFVDKTLMIKTVLEGPRRVLIITPPRFGKSTNLDMLMKFVQLHVDDAGNRVSKGLTTSFKLFMDHNLNIVKKQRKFFLNSFGTYPTINLDFKRITAGTLDGFLYKLRKILFKNIRRHEYLLESPALTRKQQDHYNMFYEEDEGYNNWDYCVLSVRAMSEGLRRHHNHSSLLAVDNLDAPILAALDDYADADEAKDIIKYLSTFMKRSLANRYVDRVILTATTYVSAVLLKGIKNIVHFPFMDNHRFQSLHGFTNQEVLTLTKKFKAHAALSKVEEWYGGYTVIGKDLNIHNPAALVCYFNSSVLNSSWVDMATIPNMKPILLNQQIGTKIKLALKNNITNVGCIDNIKGHDILRLKQLTSDTSNITNITLQNREMELLFQLMVDFGFFTVGTINGSERSLKIPNESVKVEIKKRLWTEPQERYEITDPTIKSFIKSIDGLGMKESSYKEFGKAVLELIKKFDMPSDLEELREHMGYMIFIHGQFLQFKIGRPKNKESTVGFLLVREDRTGLIIELTSLVNSSCSALNQIFHKDCDLYKELKDKSSWLELKSMIFIGIYLRPKYHCEISYLYNTSDFKYVRHVVITLNRTLRGL